MSDLEKLQGTWHVATLEIDGGPVPVPSGARIVIQGDAFQSLGMGAEYEGKVQLNSRTDPKHLDLHFTKGPEAGKQAPGIYELEADQWKLCLSLGSAPRPVKFATAPGSGHALETLRRGTAVQPLRPGDSVPEIEGEWRMTACIANGQAVPDSMVKTGRRIARDGITSSYFGKNRLLHASYKVNGNQIDYTLESGQTQSGIWKLEAGILHIAFAPPGQPRPQDFIPAPNVTLTSWTKQ